MMFMVTFSIPRIHATGAQEAATPTSAVALPPLFQAWLDTYEVEDAAGFAALYTPDGIYEDVPSGSPARGREEIEAAAASYFEYQDEYQFVPTAFFLGDDWAMMELLLSATDAESGIRVENVRVATVFELQDGLIRRSSDYYDGLTVMEQLGLLPGDAAAAAGTPVP
jgi:uncharacterized protein (TIGR02246 family)